MPSPLIRELIARRRYALVDEQSIDAFLETHQSTLLFFTENPNQFPESNDVAVILPELMKVFGYRLRVAVVDRSAERALHARYPFDGWPALVHVRNGRYVGAISRMRDWDVYLREIEGLLARDPVATPGFKIPVVSDPVGSCH